MSKIRGKSVVNIYNDLSQGDRRFIWTKFTEPSSKFIQYKSSLERRCWQFSTFAKVHTPSGLCLLWTWNRASVLWAIYKTAVRLYLSIHILVARTDFKISSRSISRYERDVSTRAGYTNNRKFDRRACLWDGMATSLAEMG
jgi:hypothetical protein